ncbi:hypothetical protein VTJ49DRAFT_5474 [Mycothermus thermophilus]|uniref:Major facilitator superfamily (MFS) profile domain-containing protein n=1 Tax=Humicola insolens TaxID=85995 RepID=A0ABR3V3K6_HUMIN
MGAPPTDQLLTALDEKCPPPSGTTSTNTTVDNVNTIFNRSVEPPAGSDIKPTTTTGDPHTAAHNSPRNGARPTSKRSKLPFLIFITLTQLVQTIPLGAGINSGLAIGASLGASPVASVWVVASYPLTQGTFVLIGGRLGEIYGHKAILTAGRKRRNLGMALFGAMAPVGAAGGSLVAAVIVQLLHWKWLFFLLGLLGSVVYGVAIASVPADEPVDPKGRVDYGGAYLGVGGLILFNFVWNQAPIVGWDTPYIISLIIISILHSVLFCYWETRVANEPILPFNIWNAPSFGILIIIIFFSFMSMGIYFWYMDIYMQTIPGDSLIQTGVQYLPLTIGGTINSFFAAWLVPRVPAQVIIGAGCLATVTINVLLATIPADLTYWAMAFPAMLLSAFTIDLVTTSAQIITSNTVPMKHQGAAGSLVGTLLAYGMSTGLGFAGTVEVNTFEDGTSLLRGYHSAAYLAVGMSGFALLLCCFIRIPKDTREGWAEDDESCCGKGTSLTLSLCEGIAVVI